MNVLRNVTEGIHPGEMRIFSGGRQTGKSYHNYMSIEQIYSYRNVAHATVDDHEWYTVKCNTATATWIRQQNKDMWYEHIDSKWTVYKNMFDIHEKIYTMLQLKFGHDRV